jgi:DNA invertase Pin-like site-specific DNA recombinase
MIQIEEFAKSRAFRIRARFREIATAMGRQKLKTDRPQLLAAIIESKRRKCPIIVASLDRIARNAESLEIWIIENDLSFISAQEGEHHNNAVMQASAARAQFEGEEIGRRTKEALAKLKKAGVKLGNRTNLPEAQRKGGAAMKQASALRAREFEAALSKAKSAGATTPREIVNYFNKNDYRTARDKVWSDANFRRALARINPISHSVTLEPKPCIAGPDRVLTPDGLERFRKAMIARGFKIGTTGKLMASMGFNRYDVSISPGLSRRQPLKPEHLLALEKWVKETEARN